MTESVPENDVNLGELDTHVASDKTSAAADGKPPLVNAERKKKKSGAFGIFRAALLMLRKRPGEKKAAKKTVSKQKSTASNGSWAKLVGSMRPLSGLQEAPESSPLHQPTPVAAAADDGETNPPQKQASAVADEGAIEDEQTIPAQKSASASPDPAEISSEETISAASPAASSSSSSSSSSRGTMSQYASAASLRDLYNSSDDEDEEEEDPDEVFDAITGDEMIDAKAEEFIAQFYKQIQLQNTAKTHHHYYRGI
ncbi:hypothetical protein ACP275_04G009800 [Erythranthe tilingii]